MQSICDGLAIDMSEKTQFNKAFEGFGPVWPALILLTIFGKVNIEDMNADAKNIIKDENTPHNEI